MMQNALRQTSSKRVGKWCGKRRGKCCGKFRFLPIFLPTLLTRQMTRQNLWLLFKPYIWYVHNCCLFVLVKHFCVDLGRAQFSVAQKL